MFQLVGVFLTFQAKHLVAHAADKPARRCVGLLVIGQAREVVERLLTLGALVDREGPVASLVHRQFGFGLENCVALETGVRSGRAGQWKVGLISQSTGLTVLANSSGCPYSQPADFTGTQVTDHL